MTVFLSVFTVARFIELQERLDGETGEGGSGELLSSQPSADLSVLTLQSVHLFT